MAAIAGDLSKQILTHSDAARTFRPWWDNLEDSLMYSLVIMGLVTLPMTFLSSTPIECTVHPDLLYANASVVIDGQLMDPSVVENYKYLRLYPKRYCTEEKLSPFLLYFPFCLFIVPLILVTVEKVFIGLYDAQTRLETLYSSLVKTSLEREDVANMEKENEKNSYEIRQSLRNSSGCYYSYLYRTMVEVVASLCLAFFFSCFSHIDGIATSSFDCATHGVGFICVIANSKFFSVVYYLSLCSILGYAFLSVYNLFWLIHPNVGKLESILSGCERRSSRCVEVFGPVTSVKSGPKLVGPEIRLDMYYDRKGKDFKLLMNLLAEQSGLAHSFRILAVFDKHFQRLWRPRDVKIILQKDVQQEIERKEKTGSEDYLATLWVLWNDAEIANYLTKRAPRSFFEYTVEVNPPTEAPIKSFLYHTVPDFSKFSTVLSGNRKISTTKPLTGSTDKYKLLMNEKELENGSRKSSHTEENFSFKLASSYKYSTRFSGLSVGSDNVYTITVSTELDGKTITQVCQQTEKSNATSPTQEKGDSPKSKKK